MQVFIDEIVCCHGILLSIIFDRGAKFTFRFWRSFEEGLGTKVKLSTTFHPKTVFQAENTIQNLEDMIRACIIDFKGNRISIYLWWSFLTTIITISLYLCLPMKTCMIGDVDIQLDGLKWARLHIWVSILFIKL